MRVVVVETDGTGGMLHFSHMLSAAVARRGHDVTLFTASDYELSDLPRDFEARPEFSLWSRQEQRVAEGEGWLKRVYVGFVRRSARAGRLFMEMWRVVSQIIAIDPDLVIVRPYPLPGHNLLLWRLKRTGTTLVEVTHEFEPRDTIHPAIARLENWLSGASSRHIDARLFMGAEIRAQYTALYPRYPADRMFLIPHGDGDLFRILADESYDPRARYGLGPEARVALFFGNLRPSKGLEDLMMAYSLADKPEGSHLLVIGHPSRDFDRKGLAELANQLGISDQVTFDMTYVPNEHVGPLFDLSRFLVLPYSSATQSGPLHIAMTFATPVVATRTGGIGDVIEDGRTGLLVAPGDIDGLAAAMSRLLDDDVLVTELGNASREHERRHSWDAVALAVMEASEKVMGRP